MGEAPASNAIRVNPHCTVRSGHARRSGLAERSPIIAWLNGKSVSDPKYPDVRWSYRCRDHGSCRPYPRRSDRVTGLDYGFGSGKHGVTFVAIQGDNTGSTLRASSTAFVPRKQPTARDYARAGGKPTRLAPRLTQPKGRVWTPVGPDRLKKCFGCHATLTSTIAQNQLETATFFLTSRASDVMGRAATMSMRRGGEKPT